MCGGGGWVPSRPDLGGVTDPAKNVVSGAVDQGKQITSDVGSASSSSWEEVRKFESSTGKQILRESVFTPQGREQIASDLDKIAPFLNIVPGAGAAAGVASQLLNDDQRTNPASDGGWGWLFSKLASGTPSSQGAGPQPAAWASGSNSMPWIIAAVGAVVLAVFLLLLRRK
jgi:hypothetical protein